jgi:hypothetical protein
MPKMHLAIMTDNKHGGQNYTTLCGKESVELINGDTNRSDTQAEVTCLLCVAIIENAKHWRHRKYLK